MHVCVHVCVCVCVHACVCVSKHICVCLAHAFACTSVRVHAAHACVCVSACHSISYRRLNTPAHTRPGCPDFCTEALFNKRADLAGGLHQPLHLQPICCSAEITGIRFLLTKGKHIIQSTVWLHSSKMRSLLLLLLLLLLLGWRDICSHLARCFQLLLFPNIFAC